MKLDSLRNNVRLPQGTQLPTKDNENKNAGINQKYGKNIAAVFFVNT